MIAVIAEVSDVVVSTEEDTGIRAALAAAIDNDNKLEEISEVFCTVRYDTQAHVGHMSYVARFQTERDKHTEDMSQSYSYAFSRDLGKCEKVGMR